MPYDFNSHLWQDKEEKFYSDNQFHPIKQRGPHCVSTVLAMLAGTDPEQFQGVVNTQDPVSWSDSLQKWGMKFAYCPTDVRKLRFYMTELIELNDLFTLSYYTTLDKDVILGEPNEKGWICGSHIVILHRDKILDPATGMTTNAQEHRCNDFHAKRVFRVVPANYQRGL
jgi:hypothetical protein